MNRVRAHFMERGDKLPLCGRYVITYATNQPADVTCVKCRKLLAVMRAEAVANAKAMDSEVSK